MDKRLHSRVSVEPQCKARFQLGGQSYTNITVSNLGAEGCCIQMPAQSAGSLNDKCMLEGWELIHPSLPKGTLRARVVWYQNQSRPKTDYIETGVRFLDAPDSFTRDVDKYVTTIAKSNPSTFM